MTIDRIVRAIYRKDMEALDRLTPADVNGRDQEGRTPLMHSVLAEDADPSVVELLIKRGADVNLTDREQGWTALHFAARDQNEALVRLLLDAGAHIDSVDVFGNTPLWRSVMNFDSNPAVVKSLLEHGADPRRSNRHGISPLDLARTSGQHDLVALLSRPTHT